MKASDDLFLLAKSLTKQEQRYFKLYATRNISKEKNNYTLLFDAIKSQNQYDEEGIKASFSDSTFIKYLWDPASNL